MLACACPRIRSGLVVVGSEVLVLVVVAVESPCSVRRLLVTHWRLRSVLPVSCQRILSASVRGLVVRSVVAVYSGRVLTCRVSVTRLLLHSGRVAVAVVLVHYVRIELRALRSVMMLRIAVA